MGFPGYYERIKRRPSNTLLRRQRVAQEITLLFKTYKGIYGVPKIHQLLIKQGEKVGIKLVQKLMRQLNLLSVVTKKFRPRHVISDHIYRENLIQTEPTEKNKAWSTDITYISTQQGWCYLSTIMDRYTKKVIAWDLGKRMTVGLVQRILNKAVQSQNESKAIILHSVQGSQYKSHEYEENLKLYGITHSFSRKGYPYHNASLESWHGHLKREWIYQFKYKNFEEAYQSIF